MIVRRIDNKINDVVKIIHEFKSHDYWTVFNDFFELEKTKILNSLYFASEDIPLNNIYDKYTNREKALFDKLFDAFLNTLKDVVCTQNFMDIAGKVFHRLDAGSKRSGQFFTPQEVSIMTAASLIKDSAIEDAIKEKGFYYLMEPTSGGGALIFAFATRIWRLGYNPQKVLLIQASDTDWRCVNMCYVQLNYYGFPAIVQQGDPLKDEFSKPIKTVMYYKDSWLMRMMGL